MSIQSGQVNCDFFYFCAKKKVKNATFDSTTITNTITTIIITTSTIELSLSCLYSFATTPAHMQGGSTVNPNQNEPRGGGVHFSVPNRHDPLCVYPHSLSNLCVPFQTFVFFPLYKYIYIYWDIEKGVGGWVLSYHISIIHTLYVSSLEREKERTLSPLSYKYGNSRWTIYDPHSVCIQSREKVFSLL